MTTARILDSGRQRRIAGLVPEPLEAPCLMSNSVGSIIVTIGPPDPERFVLKPQAELHPLHDNSGTELRVAVERALASAEHPSTQFTALGQVFATGARVIFGGDVILTKPSQRKTRVRLVRAWTT
jgi:hypothetical protein